MIQPCKNRRKWLIRRVKKKAVVHERIDTYGIDSFTRGKRQLLYGGFELVEDGRGRERRGTVGIGFETPLRLDKTRGIQLRIEDACRDSAGRDVETQYVHRVLRPLQAVYDRALYVESTKHARHRPRLHQGRSAIA